MKTTTPYFFVLALLFATTGVLPAYSQNLVTNSNFSGGSSTGWSTGCTIEVNPQTAYGGPGGSIYVTEIDVERCINQQVCILPGLTYTFTYYATRRTQAPTPASPDMRVKVTGVNSNTNYVNTVQTYSNTSWNLQLQTFTFAVPLASGDKKLNIQFLNNTNLGTYGIVLSDIELAPAAGNTPGITGPTTSAVAAPNNFSLANSPASGVSYSWSFPGGATPATSTSANPLGVKWSSMGAKLVSVAIGNGSCTMATYTQSVTISAVLAVEMTRFEGEVKEGAGRLSWDTENETGDQYFAVERSGDALRFDSIGRVQGMNSASPHTYRFEDKGIMNGSNYYRLRQVDRDGTSHYSTTLLLSNTGSRSSDMKVFPNPAGTVLNLVVNSPVAGAATLQVFDLSGAPVMNCQQLFSAGVNRLSLSIGDLGSGNYFLKLSVGQGAFQYSTLFTKR